MFFFNFFFIQNALNKLYSSYSAFVVGVYIYIKGLKGIKIASLVKKK